jgi:probable F420-dependent oxidoreductase
MRPGSVPSRPFRFGVVAGADSAASWTKLVQEAERYGYSAVLLSDHLDLSGSHVSTLSAIPAMAAAAAVTTQLRVGTSVLNQDLRHPAVLAQEAATIQLLSDGRLELGIGAGWAEQEYQWAGLPYDPAPVRVRRLREYVQVVRSILYSAGPVSFEGEFFRLDAMPGSARPGLAPPKIMIGGRGPRVLALAADCADIVNVNVVGSPGARWETLDRVLEALDGDHPRLAALEFSMMIGSVIIAAGDRREAVAERLRAHGVPGSSGLGDPDEVLESPALLVGRAEQVAEELRRRRDRWGISYYIVSYPDMAQLAPVIELLKGA